MDAELLSAAAASLDTDPSPDTANTSANPVSASSHAPVHASSPSPSATSDRWDLRETWPPPQTKYAHMSDTLDVATGGMYHRTSDPGGGDVPVWTWRRDGKFDEDASPVRPGGGDPSLALTADARWGTTSLPSRLTTFPSEGHTHHGRVLSDAVPTPRRCNCCHWTAKYIFLIYTLTLQTIQAVLYSVMDDPVTHGKIPLSGLVVCGALQLLQLVGIVGSLYLLVRRASRIKLAEAWIFYLSTLIGFGGLYCFIFIFPISWGGTYTPTFAHSSSLTADDDFDSRAFTVSIMFIYFSAATQVNERERERVWRV